MAGPVGHTLMALAVGRACAGAVRRPDLGWYVFAAFAGNAADLDFLPGFLMDAPFAFHRGASHSLLAALVVGLAVGLLARGRCERPWAVAGTAMACYLAHLLLDMPQVPLFWPVSSEGLSIPWPGLTLSLPWAHDGQLADFLTVMFSTGFVRVAMIEAAVFLPIVAVAWLVPGWRRRLANGRAPLFAPRS